MYITKKKLFPGLENQRRDGGGEAANGGAVLGTTVVSLANGDKKVTVVSLVVIRRCTLHWPVV